MILKDSRGVAAILVAMMITGLVGIAGFATDVGYIFYTRFKLQNTADATVLAAIRDIENRDTLGDNVITQNALDPAELKEKRIELGQWDPESETFTPTDTPASDRTAVRVYLQKEIPAFFGRIFGKETYHPSGQAVAAYVVKGAVVSLGATLLEVDTEKAALLNGLLGNLLGTSINLFVDGWRGIATASIDLIRFLDLAKIKLGIGTTEALLDNGEVSLLDIIDLTLQALKTEDTTARINLELLRSQILFADIDPINLKIKLGELIQIETNHDAFVKAEANVLDVIRVAAEVFNSKSAVSAAVPVNLPPLLQLDLRAKVVEPPVIKIMQVGESIHSAATRLYVNAKALDIDLGVLRTDVHVPLYLELGAGDATLDRINPDSVEMTGSSSTAKLFLGEIGPDLFFSTETHDQDDFTPATLVDVELLGIPVKAVAKSFVDAEGGSSSLTFDTPLPKTHSINATAGTSVTGLTSTLGNNLDVSLQVGPHGGLLDTLLNPLLNLLLSGLLNTVTNAVIAPVLEPILNFVSTGLGVYPGRTDISVLNFAYGYSIVQ
ncbi:MAG: pilus assembly protein TadG-related protein [Thermodesulfovibrionales bacterium]|jgi:uncharacterized membrane protein